MGNELICGKTGLASTMLCSFCLCFATATPDKGVDSSAEVVQEQQLLSDP